MNGVNGGGVFIAER